MEDPYHPQHPEDHCARKEENRYNGKKIDYSVIGYEKPEPRLSRGLLRIKKIGGPESQDVFHAEKQGRYDFHGPEKCGVGTEAVICLKDHHKDIQQDICYEQIVEYPAWSV